MERKNAGKGVTEGGGKEGNVGGGLKWSSLARDELKLNLRAKDRQNLKIEETFKLERLGGRGRRKGGGKGVG